MLQKKVQAARALEEAYLAEQKAEQARAERDRASQNANVVVAAEIQKQKAIIEAQAEAEKLRERAKGEADAIFAKLEAEARGMFEILTKQAQGLQQIVQASGDNARDAVLLLIVDKLPDWCACKPKRLKILRSISLPCGTVAMVEPVMVKLLRLILFQVCINQCHHYRKSSTWQVWNYLNT
ncbi:MAG: hypothetical protein UZ12_BCD005000579 [Bacteroidetes bacterium OLB12]|nr:MAG: hypothetical protein UZ12_BCD005000579 [Bacteroidetes bacterium OLB12]